MSSPILRESDGRITTITLNRPEAGNRMTNDMLVTLRESIDGAAESRVIVLRGAGENFCLGRELPPPPGRELSFEENKQIQTEGMLALAAAFERSPAPVVGVVRGKVHGGGCAIAGLCDITLASDDATFELPEMTRGIPPLLATAALYPRMPRKALIHFIYSTEPIDAKTALALGLLSQVVPRGNLDKTAAVLVERIAGYAPPTVRAVKDYMQLAPGIERARAVALAGDMLVKAIMAK